MVPLRTAGEEGSGNRDATRGELSMTALLPAPANGLDLPDER